MMEYKLLNLGCGSRFHPDWVNADIVPSSPDVMALDLRRKLSFEDQSFDVVYHSHVLEHFPSKFALYFLTECYRVLKPGGILRVVVPDLETIARLYLHLLARSLEGDKTARTRYDWIMLEMFDQMVRNRSGGNMLTYWKQNPMPAEDFVIERVGSEALQVIQQIRSTPTPLNIENAVSPSNALLIGRFRLSGEVHQWMYDRYSLRELLKQAGFEEIEQRRADESSIKNFNAYLLDIEADGRVRKPDSLFMEAIRPVEETVEDSRVTMLSALQREFQRDGEEPDNVVALAAARNAVETSKVLSEVVVTTRRLEELLQEGETNVKARAELIQVLIANLEGWQSNRMACDKLYGQIDDRKAGRPGLDECASLFQKLNTGLDELQEERKANLHLIQKLDAELRKCVEDLAADLALIQKLDAQLNEAKAEQEELHTYLQRLEERLRESEADRQARLELIHNLQAQLRVSEDDRAARLDRIHDLQSQLAVSEEDRAARLDRIHDLQSQLAVSEEDRAARLELIQRLDAQLKMTIAELDGLKSSLSWKLTAPLRRLRTFVRGKGIIKNG